MYNYRESFSSEITLTKLTNSSSLYNRTKNQFNGQTKSTNMAREKKQPNHITSHNSSPNPTKMKS